VTDYYTPQLDEPSNSMLSEFRRSPLAYYDAVTNRDELDTRAMSYGRAFHCALLEPERFRCEHFTLPDGKFNSLDGKIAWVDSVAAMTGVDLSEIDPSQKADELRPAVCAELERNGRTPMTAKDLGTLRAQVVSLNRPEHADVRKLIAMAQAEVEVHWVDGALKPKARIDLVIPEHRIVLDIKTTDDADPWEFLRSARSYGYDYQEAQYRMAAAAQFGGGDADEWSFAFILAGKHRPYHWSWVELDGEDVLRAHRQIQDDWRRLEQCLETNIWPGRWTPEPKRIRINRREQP
jgi:hypothetical protein